MARKGEGMIKFLSDRVNRKELERASMDMMLYGSVMVYIKNRKRYNPLYWLVGPIKTKRVRWRDMLNRHKQS
jgi:hypothetical protein